MSAKYKPILFNTKMVKAIMEGRKTMTRRVIRFTMADVYDFACGLGKWHESYDPHNPPQQLVEMYVRSIGKRPCEPGDILWVRETWAHPSEAEVRNGADPDVFIYKVDSPLLPAAHGRWHPSIHMPKEAARIFLRVKNVRIERLQDITEEQAEAEGCAGWHIEITGGPWGVEDDPDEGTAVDDFKRVWDSTIPRHPCKFRRHLWYWEDNPWVWVIEFERCEKPEGWCEARS